MERDGHLRCIVSVVKPIERITEHASLEQKWTSCVWNIDSKLVADNSKESQVVPTSGGDRISSPVVSTCFEHSSIERWVFQLVGS